MLRHRCWMTDTLFMIGWSRYWFCVSEVCEWERRVSCCKQSISQDNTDMLILTLLQGGDNTIMVIDTAMTPELIIPISIGNWHSQLINSWLTGEQTFTLSIDILFSNSRTVFIREMKGLEVGNSERKWIQLCIENHNMIWFNVYSIGIRWRRGLFKPIGWSAIFFSELGVCSCHQ